jgi:hypothetical protein
MEFEWDDTKSEHCLRDRGFTFASVVPAFADPDPVGRDRPAPRLRRGPLSPVWPHRRPVIRRRLHDARPRGPHHFRAQG